MCAVYDSIVKDFQTNLVNFVNSIENLAISTQNLAKIINHVDKSQTIVTKSVPALLDWGQNLFLLAERFEADFKAQLNACLDKEVTQPESCTIRMTMGNVYEKFLFFLNHMTHSFIDYSRSESPASASNYDCQSLASGCGPPNQQQQQRFRLMQQQQYRRWSEAAAATMEHTEANIDANRRWSMPNNPTNVSKSRLNNVIPKTLAGLVNQQNQMMQQHQQQTQSTNPDADSANEWFAIQLLSLRPQSMTTSRPPSQITHCPQLSASQLSQQQQQQPPTFQYTPAARNTQPTQSQQQQTRQRQSRGELNEILILPRSNDSSLFLGRCQQIAENIRGETDEY